MLTRFKFSLGFLILLPLLCFVIFFAADQILFKNLTSDRPCSVSVESNQATPVQIGILTVFTNLQAGDYLYPCFSELPSELRVPPDIETEKSKISTSVYVYGSARRRLLSAADFEGLKSEKVVVLVRQLKRNCHYVYVREGFRDFETPPRAVLIRHQQNQTGQNQSRMPDHELEYHRDAADEVAHAVEWYEQIDSQVATKFRLEL